MHSGIMSFSESTLVNGNRTTQTKPYLKITKEVNAIQLDFDMEGHSSVLLYCKRGDEKEFSLLEEVSNAPFLDLRPNVTKYAERRTYMAVFTSNGNPVGEADYLEIRTKGKFKFW